MIKLHLLISNFKGNVKTNDSSMLSTYNLLSSTKYFILKLFEVILLIIYYLLILYFPNAFSSSKCTSLKKITIQIIKETMAKY